MMLDIDDFKAINDKYGHMIGDKVLIHTVTKLKQTIRSSDQLIRWGGDEFLAIFPGLRSEYLTRFGYSLLNVISSSDNDAIKRADEALYQAKLSGKNKVKVVL